MATENLTAPVNGRVAIWLTGPVAAVAFACSVIGFAAARTDGYSHATKAVSELGAIGAPHAMAFNVLGFILPGLLIAVMGIAMLRLDRNKIGPLLVTGSGVMHALAGASPAQMHDFNAMTTRLHIAGAMGAGFLWLAALFWMGPLLSRQVGLMAWGKITPWFGFFLVANIGWQIGYRATGLILPGWGQRIGFLGYFLWFALTGILLWQNRQGSVAKTAIPSGPAQA